MAINHSTVIAQCNGQSADRDTLVPLAFSGYAHFTAMQVRNGGVRGLDLHLQRLRQASITLFGQAIPGQQVLAHLRSAMASSPADVSLTATVYSPAGEFVVADSDVLPNILVRTGAASAGPKGPLALATFEYERVLPAVKHVGEVAKTYFLRRAAAQGFDDAAFLDRYSRVSEGTIWNLAFWDGDAVVWPEANMLQGITMSILRRQLSQLGIAQRDQAITVADISGFSGAVVMNSWTPAIAVRRIDTITIPTTPALVTLLHRAYQSEPLVAL